MIAIFGATARVGGTAAKALREQGLATRAIVRAPAGAAPLAALGCELSVADLHDLATVRGAVRGAAAVLVICPLRPDAEDLLADTQHLVDTLGRALEAERPAHVVAISDYGAQHATGTGLTTIFHGLEQRLRALSSALTLVRSSEHMQNWTRQLPLVRARGVVTSLHQPTSRTFPMVSAFDVGRIAAELLIAVPPAPGAPRIVHVEGPRRHSADDVAAAYADVLARPVTAQALPREHWTKALTATGSSTSYAQLIAELQDAHNEGRIDVEEGVGEQRRAPTELSDALALLSRAAHPTARS